MKALFFFTLLGLPFIACGQKLYTQGYIDFEGRFGDQIVNGKIWFKGDSAAKIMRQGPATIKTITYKDYISVLIDVPLSKMLIAGIGTPGEVEEYHSILPSFTFERTDENKIINGFKCIKVNATDIKTAVKTDVWVTNDISAPTSAFGEIFDKVGGFPIQFTANVNGKTMVNSIIKVVQENVPKDMFTVLPQYEKLTLNGLNTLITKGSR